MQTPNIGELIGLKKDELYTVTKRYQCIQLVLSKRFEVYIDEEKVMKDSVHNLQDKIDKDEYRIETISETGWYMISTNNERGRKIMDLYEEGFLRLKQSGELKKIYHQFNLSLP